MSYMTDEQAIALAESLGVHSPSRDQIVTVGLIQAVRIIESAVGWHNGEGVVLYEEAYRALGLYAVQSLRSRLASAEELTALKQGIIEAADTRIRELAARLDSAERENERLLIENRRWVPRIEITGASASVQTIESHSPTPTQGGTNG